MTTHATRIQQSQTNTISLIIAPQPLGLVAWYFIRVHPPKLARFRRDVTAGAVDLSAYGEVIERGWGDAPPPDVVARMQANHGFIPAA